MVRHLLRLALLAALLSALPAHAQKIAFVDTKYILGQMPEYAAAQQELDKNSKDWQTDIDDKWAQIKRLRESFNAEAVLLTEEMKKSRQAEIDKKEQEARDLQQKRFGVGGDLFKKREELIQPIQDRVFDAVKEVAGTSYIAIFDIGGPGNNVLYASDKNDKSDSVLRKLGIRPGKDKGDKNPGNLNGEDGDKEAPATGPGDKPTGGSTTNGGTNPQRPTTNPGQTNPNFNTNPGTKPKQ